MIRGNRLRRGIALMVLAASAAAISILLPSGPLGVGPTVAKADPVTPNFVLIVTDDQRWDSVGRCLPVVDPDDYAAGTSSCMPSLQQDLMANGVVFERGYVPTSLCCPSRASILTGLYAQHHGVVDNHGYPDFDDTSTLATWLDDAGYRTGLIGKYLNDYGEVEPLLHVPPGWDSWHAFYGAMGDGRGYKTYSLIQTDGGEQPVVTDYQYVNAPPNSPCSTATYYSTDHLCGEAIDFLQSDASSPFFLMFAPFSPHSTFQMAGRHSQVFSQVPFPTYPNVNQVPSPNPPSWLRDTPLTSTDLNRAKAGYIAALKTNLAVDESIGSLYDQLASDGRLSNTVWIFLSDNGRAIGEHRFTEGGKFCEFEECGKVPFIVACPPAVCPDAIPGQVDATHIALNIDLAPTIAEMAGVPLPGDVDGRSLVPLLNDPAIPWRDSYLQLNARSTAQGGASMGITKDHPDGHTYKYVTIPSLGEEQLYDLTLDPWELSNLIDDGIHTAIQDELAAEFAARMSPPAITIDGPIGPTNDLAAFSWSSDTSATFTCWLDDAVPQPCGSGMVGDATFDPLAEGDHTFHLRAVDDDLNTASIDRAFTRDVTAPPSPTFTSTPPDPGGSHTTFAFADLDSSASFLCSLDEAPSTPCVSPVVFPALGAGSHTFEVAATDAAGNAAAQSATYTWTVDPLLDSAAPTSRLLKPTVDQLLTTTSVAANWSATDNVGVVNHELSEQVDGGAWNIVKTGKGTTFTRTGQPGSTYCYRVRSFDAVGNVGRSPIRCAGVPFDDRAPQIMYSGTTTQSSPAGTYLNTLTTLDGVGDAATMTFTGRRVGLLASKGPNAGKVDVAIDGIVVKQVDLYAGVVKNKTVVYQIAVPQGTHTIDVTWVPMKNLSSTGFIDTIDGIVTVG